MTSIRYIDSEHPFGESEYYKIFLNTGFEKPWKYSIKKQKKYDHIYKKLNKS